MPLHSGWSGSRAASKMGGYLRPRLEPHREFLERLRAEKSDITLQALCDRLLAERGVRADAPIAGLPDDVSNMDARAGAVTEALESGAPLEDVQRAATHSRSVTTLAMSAGSTARFRPLLRRGAELERYPEWRQNGTSERRKNGPPCSIAWMVGAAGFEPAT
jgi:hypothetical protein